MCGFCVGSLLQGVDLGVLSSLVIIELKKERVGLFYLSCVVAVLSKSQ